MFSSEFPLLKFDDYIQRQRYCIPLKTNKIQTNYIFRTITKQRKKLTFTKLPCIWCIRLFYWIVQYNIFAGKPFSNKSNSSGFLYKIRLNFLYTWYYLLCDLLQLCHRICLLYDTNKYTFSHWASYLTCVTKKKKRKIKEICFVRFFTSYISTKYLQALCVRQEEILPV